MGTLLGRGQETKSQRTKRVLFIYLIVSMCVCFCVYVSITITTKVKTSKQNKPKIKTAMVLGLSKMALHRSIGGSKENREL